MNKSKLLRLLGVPQRASPAFSERALAAPDKSQADSAPMPDPLAGTVATVEDIPNRELVDPALGESEQRLRFALEGANDGLWDVQMQTGEVYLSPRGCEILGYRPEELAEVARAWSDLVYPADMPVAQARLDAHLEGRAVIFEVEQRLRMKSGE
jgi:PAS domain S-box-containing protein